MPTELCTEFVGFCRVTGSLIIFSFLFFALFHLNTEQPLRRRAVARDLFESFVLFGIGILDFISWASSNQFRGETLVEHDPATSRGRSLLRDANFLFFFFVIFVNR